MTSTEGQMKRKGKQKLKEVTRHTNIGRQMERKERKNLKRHLMQEHEDLFC